MMIVTPGMLKRRALQLLKPNLNAAMMLTFLAMLPSLLAQAASTIAVNPMLDVAQQWIVTLRNTGATPAYDTMLQQLQAAVGQREVLLFALTLALGLACPVMELSWIACLQRLARQESVETKDILCRMQYFIKAVGLVLLRVVKMLLWALPGWAFYFLCFLGAALLQSVPLLNLAPLGAYAAVVLDIRAELHYSMSTYILAEKPDMPLRACIRESVTMMRRRKLQYLLLQLSFIGWTLLLTLISNMAAEASMVTGLTLQMLLSLPLTLYRTTTITIYYDLLKTQANAE